LFGVITMEYAVEPAKISDREIIKRLLQPYLTELSQFDDISPDHKNEKGEYIYPYLNDYWREDNRFPYLFYCNGKLAGFALVRRVDYYYEMAEFYVLPEFRGHSLGMACATDIFRRHAGIWRIGFNKQNFASRQLWGKLAQKLANGDIEEGEADTSHDYIRFSVS
jgi:predicted acetyltransferase